MNARRRRGSSSSRGRCHATAVYDGSAKAAQAANHVVRCLLHVREQAHRPPLSCHSPGLLITRIQKTLDETRLAMFQPAVVGLQASHAPSPSQRHSAAVAPAVLLPQQGAPQVFLVQRLLVWHLGPLLPLLYHLLLLLLALPAASAAGNTGVMDPLPRPALASAAATTSASAPPGLLSRASPRW